MSRRRLQFSLPTLILAVLLSGYAIGCLGRYIKSEWEMWKLERKLECEMRQITAEWERIMRGDTNPYQTYGGVI